MTIHADVAIAVAPGLVLDGNLTLPDRAHAAVLFAHGSGSSRHSPRNRQVAEVLQRAGLATLLIDLQTTAEEAEERETHPRPVDVGLLARRLVAVTRWLHTEPATHRLPVGLFGASTGAAAALVAAASHPEGIGAVVSRGGRPDLAGDALAHVRAPTLLIVGGADTETLLLNRAAAPRLRAKSRIEVVPGAGHLFEEPDALQKVADLARDWFARHLIDRVLPS